MTWLRAALGTLVAWLGLSIGLGIGLPRLFDGAMSVTAVLAGAALLLGVVALVAVTVLILRAARGWRRLALLPWLVVVAVATYALSIALAATRVAPTAEPGPPPGLGGGAVAMTTADGVQLSGWYVPSTNGAAVIVRHGSGSTRADTVGQARVLAGRGYGVLLVDARGHGASGGRAMDLGWYGEADTAAAVDLLLGRPDVVAGRIGVLGMSMGGEEAIGAAGADRRIRAVVAEGATGRTADDKAWMVEEYGLAGRVQRVLDALTYGLVDLLTPASPPPSLRDSIVAAAPTPILLIAGDQVADEPVVGQRLVTAAPGSATLWVVPGAGHIAGLATAPQEWEDRVIGFLDAALLGSR